MIGRLGMIGRGARTRWAAVAVLAIGAGGARPASAQVGVESLPLAAAYGAGVHAYFSGDYDRTVADLGSIIAAGSADPRAHYFRGLALLRMGRMEEAEADFADGADLETGNLGQWPVSRSLERVQGADRLQLERHRVRARVAKLQRDRDALRARMDESARAESDVLRERRPAPTLPPGSVESNPFAGEDGDAPSPDAPSVDEERPVDEPVATPGSGADEPVASTPPAEEPMEEEVPENPPAEPATDPPAEAEEPTELEAEMPPDAAAPAAEAGDDGAPAAEAQDPFGDGPAPDAASTPAEGEGAKEDGEMEADAEPVTAEAAEDADETDADETDADETDADETDADETDADEVDGEGTEPVIEGE